MAKAEKKAYFISELEVKLAKGDGIWELEAPLAYWSPLVGRIQVPAGFQTDFASVPRVPIAYWLYGARAHREGVIHDYLFRKDCVGSCRISFMDANKVFLEAMEARKKPFYVRWPMYAAVCAFSYPCFHKRKVFDKL